MTAVGNNTLNTRSELQVGARTYAYYSLAKAAASLGDVSRLPFSMKVLLENLLRFEDGNTVTRPAYLPAARSRSDIVRGSSLIRAEIRGRLPIRNTPASAGRWPNISRALPEAPIAYPRAR